MYMPKICLFTFFALYCIFIILGFTFVYCAPVTAVYEAHSTSKVNQHEENIFNSETEVFQQISPETIPGLTIAGLFGSQDFIIEGDILIQVDKNAVDRKWPAVYGNVLLPYVIHPQLASRTDDIEAAMNMISSKSCVTFHKREHEENYLIFKPHYGCASYVGFIGGEQPIFVGPFCSVGNICHELLHALGFHHEHSRVDRDQHIKIVFQNIIKGKERNFRKVKADTLGVAYDLGSILHYGSWFFSSNGKPTVVPQNSNQKIGQRTHLSELDVQRLQKLYSCQNKKPKLLEAIGQWSYSYYHSGNSSVTPGTPETTENHNVTISS